MSVDCVCICVCMLNGYLYVCGLCVCVCVHACTCVEAKGQPWDPCAPSIRQDLLLAWSSRIRLDWVSRELQESSYLSLLSARMTGVLPCLAFMWVMRMELRSSCF